MPNKIYTLKTKHRISQSIATWINLLPILQNMESSVTIQFRKMSSWLCSVPLNMSFTFSEPKSIRVNQVFSMEEINGFLVGWGGRGSEKNWLFLERNHITIKYQDRSQYYNVLGAGNWKCSFRGMMAFPGGSDSKASAYSAGDLGSIPGSGRSPGEGKGNPLQYSCLENPMDRGAWLATVHGVAKSRTRLSVFTITITTKRLRNTSLREL